MKMDKFLRFFIKFHGYCICTVSSILTPLFTALMSTVGHTRYDLIDLRFTGIPVLILGIAWMIANSLLIIGIVKERKTFLYPFCVLFLIELFMVVLRDMYLVISGDGWYKTAFFNVTLPLLLFIVPYVVLSMMALMRLFDVDPIQKTDDNFVRFDRDGPEEVDRVTIGG
ncbi:AAEL001358-PA [Aedes aegypti]|uniref:AAEL001358-PA n=2 Tax=Aedes aegypti TaxID=7159 RepID=A0A1S4EYN2_AEDAE|nr:uncharacterized protein LOC5570085 [Aedes aegypti]EAT47561.1 AAEL001358-PA [Aedes aegypti]